MIKYYDSLTIPATLDSLSAIANYIKQVGNWANLHPKKVTKLRLAVDEIATNIIDYGYSQSQGKNVIEIHAKLESSQLILWIEDTAIAYDPNQQQTPQDLDKPLEEREIGGLGIYLARINVDQFIYERINNEADLNTGKNRNTFIVNLKSI